MEFHRVRDIWEVVLKKGNKEEIETYKSFSSKLRYNDLKYKDIVIEDIENIKDIKELGDMIINKECILFETINEDKEREYIKIKLGLINKIIVKKEIEDIKLENYTIKEIQENMNILEYTSLIKSLFRK